LTRRADILAFSRPPAAEISITAMSQISHTDAMNHLLRQGDNLSALGRYGNNALWAARPR